MTSRTGFGIAYASPWRGMQSSVVSLCAKRTQRRRIRIPFCSDHCQCCVVRWRVCLRRPPFLFRQERGKRTGQGGGRFRISPPSLDPLLIQTAKRGHPPFGNPPDTTNVGMINRSVIPACVFRIVFADLTVFSLGHNGALAAFYLRSYDALLNPADS